jgi:phosphoglycerol transferase MdoB-like AlkP superfamily enzyme
VIGMGLSDDDFFSQTLTKMQHLPQPFFAMLITLSGHHPFTLPAGLRSGVTDNVSGLSEEVKKYLENVNFVDRALEKFWRNSEKLRENSIVVLVGDHNPSLPSRKDWSSLGYSIGSIADPAEDPDFLPLRQVPLIVSAPFFEPQINSVKGVRGDLTDIAPTLLYLLGIQQPKYFVGGSLFSEAITAIEYTQPFSIYFDNKRHVNIGTGECFSNVGNEQLEKINCYGLKSEADAIGIISKDVLWGNRYSYRIQ